MYIQVMFFHSTVAQCTDAILYFYCLFSEYYFSTENLAKDIYLRQQVWYPYLPTVACIANVQKPLYLFVKSF